MAQPLINSRMVEIRFDSETTTKARINYPCVIQGSELGTVYSVMAHKTREVTIGCEVIVIGGES